MCFLSNYISAMKLDTFIKSFKNINTVKISHEFKCVIKYYQVSQMVLPFNNPKEEFSIDKLSLLRGCVMNEKNRI